MAPIVKILPFIEWVSLSIVCLLASVLHLIILRSELKKRRQSKNELTPKSLQLTSLICIISGLLTNVSWFLSWYNGYCHFGGLLTLTLLCTQGVSMGLYQLSRLYYSFANDKVHSNKGYPKYLFIIMTIIGIILLIEFPPAVILTGTHGSSILASKCGINSKYESYFHHIHDIHIKFGYIWYTLSGLIYWIWDVLTVVLYAIKIKSFRTIFKESQPSVYKRILCILYKIFILSMFYEFCSIISLIGQTMDSIFHPPFPFSLFMDIDIVLVTISTSYSMYLMIEYNHKQYIQFLKVIYKFRLYYLCCCCKYMVIDQINQFIENEVNNLDNKTKPDFIEGSIETTKKSVNDQRINMDDMELSVQTPDE